MNYKTIFNYYKKKYKLNCQLFFGRKYDSIGNYDLKDNKININRYCSSAFPKSKSCIYSNCDNSYQTVDFKTFILFTLLHEIKHAIDYKENKLTFSNIFNRRDYFEKRANNFAKKELNKYYWRN